MLRVAEIGKKCREVLRVAKIGKVLRVAEFWVLHPCPNNGQTQIKSPPPP